MKLNKLEDDGLEKLAEVFDGVATKAARARALVSKDRMWKSPSLDKGIYDDAKKENKTVTEFLTDMEYSAGFGDGASDDPSAYYGKTQKEISHIRVKAMLHGERPPLTVVEKQMLHAGVSRFATVDKLYTLDTSLRTLFPEIIVQDVQDGNILAGLVSPLAADTVTVPFTDRAIRAWTIDDGANDQDAIQLRRVAKGAEIPKTKLAASERTLQLAKWGRALDVAYEDIAGVTLDFVGRWMRRVGLRMSVDETDDLIAALFAGDSSSGAPTNVVQPAATGLITLADMLEFWSSLPAPFQMTHMIGRTALGLTYFTTLYNFAGASSGFARVQDGPFTRPIELTWDRDVVPTDRFIGIDRANAISWYESAVLTEEDRLINKQVKLATVSKISGAKINELAAISLWDTSY